MKIGFRPFFRAFFRALFRYPSGWRGAELLLFAALLVSNGGCMSAREFDEAARRQSAGTAARPLSGAWVGRWRYGSGQPLPGKVRVILSGDEPLPSWAPSACHLGAHDYLVQMETVAGVFPLWATVDHDVFILRMETGKGDAVFFSGKNALGPSDNGANFLCTVYACASSGAAENLELAFWAHHFAKKCDYVLELKRFVLPRPRQ